MNTKARSELAGAAQKAVCPVSGGQIFLGACAIVLLIFAVAAVGAVDHFDKYRAPALIVDTPATK